MATHLPKILAIDDTPANLLLLANALSRDFTFQLATSGPSGLAMAETSAPDLILLDVMMPEVDGFETCRRFKADPRLARIPIIFVTALSDAGSEMEALRLGAADFLSKPINVDVAHQRIANLLEREALRREVEERREHLEQMVAERTRALEIANAELADAKYAAETANRVKTHFLANVSHELRTPLNVILGMNHLLRRKLQDDDLCNKSDKIDAAGRQLIGMIDDILHLTRMEGTETPAPVESFCPHDLVGEVQAFHQKHAMTKGLLIRHEIDSSVPPAVLGQPSRIRQALQNLVSNAVKFSDRGDVTVRVQLIESAADGAQLQFSVSDHGIGIEADRLPDLLQAFTQADTSSTRRFGGLGVGLTVAHRLVKLMGGHLDAESAPGQGSRFTLSVPVQQEAAQPQRGLAAPAATSQQH
jgi:signal transduction histidine kinase